MKIIKNNQILAAKKQPPSSPFSKGEYKDADTSALERQIDEMVGQAQDLPLQRLHGGRYRDCGGERVKC
jgi:biotin synthase-related radical SAM superfamily protein